MSQALPRQRPEETRARSATRMRETATPRRHRRREATRRQAAEPVALNTVLLNYWNEHAVKTGIVLFWGWFTLANWDAFVRLAN